ncbi:MAG: protein kinase [Planctomycetaceae bacterium]
MTSNLVTDQHIEDAMIGNPGSVDELLTLLERKQHLTSYQSGRIKKGLIGDLTIGDYKLLYRNASGSFARVFRAASLSDGRMVALKLLRARWAKEPEFVQNFYREATVIRRFDHLNIVPIYDVGEDNGRHYFTMEFVEGGNLRDFIRIRKKLAPVEGARCMIDICSGLDYAIGLGVTHRDLKMTNILMSSKGVAKLVDFGLAGEDSYGGEVDDGNQRALEYATLEKGTNAPRNDPRSDIFFAGAILYELISGQAAWPSTKSREERRQFSRYFNIRPLGQIDPAIPKCMTDVVERMMETTPDSRYQTPGEAVADLRDALAEMGESTGRMDSGKKAAPTRSETTKPTILCVENRIKQQEVLREYFGTRGYRLLLMSDYDRAKTRMKSENKPDCVVVMGAVANGDLKDIYEDMRQAEAATKVPALIVMKKARALELQNAGVKLSRKRVLVQPINLKQLRTTIDKVVQAK